MLPLIFIWCTLLALVFAKTHEFHFNASLVDANPDGTYQRKVIGFNGEWPLPVIRVAKHDRVVIQLTNGMPDRNISLHFHGLFMESQNSMDGPEYMTQCPIPPGITFVYDFTVNQTGTYWYHLHLGSQYSDGLRGMFIVEETAAEKYPFEFDEEVALSVSDWYHMESPQIMKSFMSRYNPTGAEPIPQNSLFNDTRNVTWTVEADKTYFLRIVNMGMFVSQYLAVEGHTMQIVEVDGVYVEPVETDLLYIAVAQRYGVLLTTKKNFEGTFRFINALDEPMLDVLPEDLQIISTNYMQYRGDSTSKPKPLENGPGLFDNFVASINPVDDFELRPVQKMPLLPDPDYQIVLNFTMEQLGDGVTYALFNGITYTPPKVPTLYSVLSSGALASNPAIYGSNTNTFVLQYGEVVEIVLNNMDPGLHPFHLHGHNFQVISRSEGTDDDEHPQVYDRNNPNHTHFPLHPMVRDTAVVHANGFIVLRFEALNPGVWFFHCHVDWHLEQGLAITLVEAPLEIQKDQKPIDDSHFAACSAGHVSTVGNAAGHYGSLEAEWLDLAGENVQKQPLPDGFTARGYIALALCSLAALYGVFSIYQYGMEDVSSDNAEHMVSKLYLLVAEYEEGETSTMLTLDSSGNRVASQGGR